MALWVRKPRTLGIEVSGALPDGVFAKDLALAIHHIGTSGGVGQAIEYGGAGGARPVDGGAADPVQHDHRGRRSRWPRWPPTPPPWPT